MSDKKLDVASIAVRDSSGEVDVDATAKWCYSQIAAYAELHKNDREKILAAMNEIFDETPGLRANVPAVKTMVLNKVGFTTASFNPLMERIGEVLDSNELLMVQKGPQGGVRLRSEDELSFYRENGRDRNAEEIKALKAAQKKSA